MTRLFLYCDGAFKWKIMKNATETMLVCCTMIKVIARTLYGFDLDIMGRKMGWPKACKKLGKSLLIKHKDSHSIAKSNCRLSETKRTFARGCKLICRDFFLYLHCFIKRDWFSHSINMNYARRHSRLEGSEWRIKAKLVKCCNIFHQQFWARLSTRSFIHSVYDLFKVFL